MRTRWPRRALIRTRVLAGVLLVTLIALAAFDVAAVTAARTYLIGQTDSQLRDVLALYGRLAIINRPPPSPGGVFRIRNGTPAQRRLQSGPSFTPSNGGPPYPRAVQTATLQPFSVLLVTGKKVRAVSPDIVIRGVVIGGTNLMPRLPQDLTAWRRAARR